jgi:hypothetical protein
MILAYTGTQWSRLWEGNGSTQNLERLPGKVVICMDQGGWTNVRRGPGLDYPRAGKVRQPTAAKALEARLTKALGKTPGEAWYRIPYGGRFGWVQNLRTMRPWLDGSSPTQTCRDWRRYYANHVAAGLREAKEESHRGSLQWGHEPVRGNVPLGQRAVSVDESLSRGHSGRGLIPGEGRE